MGACINSHHMRKYFFTFIILGSLVLGFGLFNNFSPIGKSNPQSTNQPPTSVLGVEKLTPQITVAEPVTFSIPKLNIENATVESVGLNNKGAMDIPKKDENVAWYNLGSKPGELGSAVIAGHFDTKTGSPAVFYNLNKLKNGDELKVKDKNGKEYTYIVTNTQTYELAEFPLVEVFAGPTDKSYLNLITCEGTYDKSSKLYSHRLVIYSELKS